MYERLTEFWDGIWGLSPKAIKQGYDRYSVYSRLAAYEDSGLSPEEVQELKDAVLWFLVTKPSSVRVLVQSKLGSIYNRGLKSGVMLNSSHLCYQQLYY